MSESQPDFVEWKEQYINQERGSRLVHYYLEDSCGQSYLAVVGTERSLRHMLYVASEDFCQAYGLDKSGVSALKWRSRREVIDWLSSFIPGRMSSRSLFKPPLALPLAADMSFNGASDSGSYHNGQAEFCSSFYGQCSDITWSGASWICGKQLKHYQAFCRNGIAISTHSFVLVMSEEENRYLAYLEDMYEDKKGQKKVKVRWFHQNKEFSCTIPPPTPHPCEVFITPYSQVISVECVDDIATVLTPDHYGKCLATLPYSSSAGIRFCFRQYSKNKFKLFDLSSLRGYFNQAVLSCLDICSVSGDEGEFGQGSTIKRGASKRIRFVKGTHKSFMNDHFGVKTPGHANHMKSCNPTCQNSKHNSTSRRPLSVKFVGPRNLGGSPFDVDEKIELLCQDSGIRGCWFKCTVLQLSHNRLKLRYCDVQDEDGCGNLEEWVPAFRKAAPDKFGMRCSGRLNIRPSPSSHCLLEDVAVDIGMAVDAWWSDGWWEGVVTGVEGCGDDSLQVYFPGEDIFLVCQRKSLRVSKDWVENKWIEIPSKPDILSRIAVVSPQAKSTSCSVLAKGTESGSSVMSDRVAVATQADTTDGDRQVETSVNHMNDDGLVESVKHIDTKDKLVILSAAASVYGDGLVESAKHIDAKDEPIILSAATSVTPLKLISCSIATNVSALPDCGADAVQDDLKDEDKQMETSLTTLPENAEPLNSRKRQRVETNEEDSATEDGLSGENS